MNKRPADATSGGATPNNQPPGSAFAVVIGAGAFGFATAFELANLGMKDVVLLDAYEPGTQTSPRAAGLFKMMQASETKTRLAKLAREVVTGFERETGVAMPHVLSGSIMTARTPEHAAMIDVYAEDSRCWGVELERIDPAEAHRHAPYLEADGLLTAYSIPDDFYIEEPRSMLLAYWQAATRLGVKVLGHSPVTGIVVRGGEVVGVETNHGEILTGIVVDCAGVWSRWIGSLAGAFVPVQPMRHQLRITAPLAGMTPDQPIVRLVDAAAYARPCRGGLMIGNFETDPMPINSPQGSGYTIDMVPLDPGVTERAVAAVNRSMPAAMAATAQEERGGLFTMTADGRFLVGPVPNVRGFWMATGCNGSGFSLSSAVGRCLAEWIVNGESPIDLTLLSPSRFTAETLTDATLQQESIWQYANYYTPATH